MKFSYWKYLLMAGYFIVVLLFLFFYFFPSLKTISQMKVESIDALQRMQDFNRMESLFVFPDNKEKELVKAMQERVHAELVRIKKKEDLLQLFNEIFAFLQKQADQFRIQELLISTTSKDMAIESTPLKKSDPQALSQLLTFMNSRLIYLEKERMQAGVQFSQLAGETVPPEQKLLAINNLAAEHIYLTFSAPLINSLQFIASLYSDRFHLELRRMITGAGVRPNFFLILKFNFIDERQNVKK